MLASTSAALETMDWASRHGALAATAAVAATVRTNSRRVTGIERVSSVQERSANGPKPTAPGRLGKCIYIGKRSHAEMSNRIFAIFRPSLSHAVFAIN